MLTRPARAALGLAVLATVGCASAHRCVIPARAPAERAAEPLPIHVGVLYAPGLAARTEERRVGDSTWTLPVGAAAMEAFNAVLPRLFATASDGRAPPPAGGGAEALLTLDIGDVRLRPGPFRPEHVELTATALLSDREGAELARASATVAADGEPVHALGAFHCDSLGASLSLALADAAQRIGDDLAASPRLQEWARERAAARAASADGGAPATAPTLPAPPPQGKEETRWRRPAGLPRYLGGGFTYGKLTSSAPGIGTRGARGWNVYFGWDLTEWLDLGLRGTATHLRVGWTPDPSDTDSAAEAGFLGFGVAVRLLPGRAIDPWIGADLAYHAVTWDEYVYMLGGWGLLGSVGVDLRAAPFGVVRLAASYAGPTVTVSSPYGQTGPAPAPEDDGARAPMRTWWLTVAWLFDLGPAR